MSLRETATCDFCFKRIEGFEIRKIKTKENSSFRETLREYSACPHCFDRIGTFMGLLKKEAWESLEKKRRIK